MAGKSGHDFLSSFPAWTTMFKFSFHCDDVHNASGKQTLVCLFLTQCVSLIAHQNTMTYLIETAGYCLFCELYSPLVIHSVTLLSSGVSWWRTFIYREAVRRLNRKLRRAWLLLSIMSTNTYTHTQKTHNCRDNYLPDEDGKQARPKWEAKERGCAVARSSERAKTERDPPGLNW